MSSTTITPVKPEDIQSTFSTCIDLISKPLGSQILAFSDEWFAAASNLTAPTPPVRKPGVYTPAGAWYDGWETRRHNAAPFDWVVLRLGVAAGRVRGVEIDTAFFDGNHAPEIAVQGAHGTDEAVVREDFDGWTELLARQECGPSCRQAWRLAGAGTDLVTHVRLLMFPDGGIARFRLYGMACPVFPAEVDARIDLAATVNGGVAVSCSDEHFGRKENLLLPGRGVDMGDGWETKRTRGIHVDWVVIRLGAKGYVDRVIIDTAHFRGNFPKEVQVFAVNWDAQGDPPGDSDKWVEILKPQRTGPDKEHEYDLSALENVQGHAYTHVKLVIIPDGGVKRIRVLCKRAV